MSGKGRVKDLVDKLNSSLCTEIKKSSECPKLSHGQESKTIQIQEETKSIDERDDLDALNAKKRIPETKIPNHKMATKTTKHEKYLNENKFGNINGDNHFPTKFDNEENSEDSWIKLVGADNLYKILSDKHRALQKAHCKLKKKYAEEECKRIAAENELKNTKLIKCPKDSTEALQNLREKENQLMAELQELREQNELLEFRLLELEYYNTNGSKTETSTTEEITERDDISDSGVMSLSPCEDFFSECDLQDIKLDEDEPRVTGNEVQQKLTRMFQYAENTSDKVTLQQAIDLIKHYQMRITGMEATLTNMCQERFNQHSEEFLTSLKNPDECPRSKRPIGYQKCYYSERSQELPDKLFLDMDRLQESGIFDEFLEHDLIERKSRETQTEPFPDTGTGLVDELNKLEKIKRRIEERNSLFADEDCTKIVPNLNSKELMYYKKQYEILKTKLSAYETSNDTKIKQLTDQLNRENVLENRVKYLTNKIAKIESDMKKLEEEKCEYEEAENDTRLRCQKLEVKLYALAEKKNDLQFQLQQHIRIVSNLRNTLAEVEKKKQEACDKCYNMEITINDLEERNFELEEREMDVRYRLQVLESVLPAILAWNLYIYLKNFQRCFNTHKYALPQPTVSVPTTQCRNDQLEHDLYEKQRSISKLKDHETELRAKIVELEEKHKYLQSNENSSWSQPYKLPTMKNRIQELEIKEEVYVQTLQQADEMITEMENNFKQKLHEMQNALTDKGWKLEECERKLAAVSLTREMENHLMEKIQNLESEIIALKQIIKSKEDEKQAWLENEKYLKEELDNLNTSLALIKQNERDIRKKLEQQRNIVKEQKEELLFKENLLQDLENNNSNEVKQLEKKILKLTRELENHEVTNSELKEEVDTLEGAICELNLTLNREKDDKERILVKFRQELATKQQEIDSLKRLSQDMTAISTAQEISLLQNERQKLNLNLSDKYSNTLPKIVSINEKHQPDKARPPKYKDMSEKINGKKESSAHIIRHKDYYTILLKPSPNENYSNFEVTVNNNQNMNVNLLKPTKLLGNVTQNDTISLMIKPI